MPFCKEDFDDGVCVSAKTFPEESFTIIAGQWWHFKGFVEGYVIEPDFLWSWPKSVIQLIYPVYDIFRPS